MGKFGEKLAAGALGLGVGIGGAVGYNALSTTNEEQAATPPPPPESSHVQVETRSEQERLIESLNKVGIYVAAESIDALMNKASGGVLEQTEEGFDIDNSLAITNGDKNRPAAELSIGFNNETGDLWIVGADADETESHAHIHAHLVLPKLQGGNVETIDEVRAAIGNEEAQTIAFSGTKYNDSFLYSSDNNGRFVSYTKGRGAGLSDENISQMQALIYEDAKNFPEAVEVVRERAESATQSITQDAQEQEEVK
jgi:hypothetical protein